MVFSAVLIVGSLSRYLSYKTKTSDHLPATNDVNIHKRDTYKVYYNVSDAAGNKTEGESHTVIVEIF